MQRNLSEEDIIYLNKLKQKNLELYNRKLKILRITDEDVPKRSISNVFVSDRSIYQDKASVQHSYDPYKYSWEWDDEDYEMMDDYDYSEDNNDNTSYKDSSIHNLYLIDGDNHIYEAIERIDLADETDDVRIYVSQDGLYNRLINKRHPHVTVIKVKPGEQAVDNQIKSVFGNAVKNGQYDDIFVISNDKGYDKLIQEYRSKYKKKKNHLDRREKF